MQRFLKLILIFTFFYVGYVFVCGRDICVPVFSPLYCRFVTAAVYGE